MQYTSIIVNMFKGVRKRILQMLNNPDAKVGLDFFTLKKLKHLTAGKEETFNFKNKLIYFLNPIEFLITFREIFREEIYNAPLGPKPFIIDCGANIGISTLYFTHQFPDAEVIAFEPDDTNFAMLQKNVRSWQLNNVKCCKQAVWIENTTLNFSNNADMGSKIESGSSSNTIQVEAIRLKDILTKKVDFLKIDIEGAEFDVLLDIKDHLHFVHNMFFEYHGTFQQQQHLNDIFQILTDAGFTYYIKEAASVYDSPFIPATSHKTYDVQLNIFCFRH